MQVNVLFVTAVKKLQSVLSRAPEILNQVSSKRSSFDLVISIIMDSGLAAIVVMIFVITFIWYGIFKNWRIRVMEMRQGR